MIRKYLAWLFRRPVAAFTVCISLILVVQVLIIVSWNWESDNSNIKYRNLPKADKSQQLPIAKFKGKEGKILGLKPTLQHFYKADGQGMWSCLDKSEIIPFSFVNDDYCDCKDGSGKLSLKIKSKVNLYILTFKSFQMFLFSGN